MRASTPPLTAILLLSAVALAYEVLLVRMFSIIHWHHFAFMVISVALLGYGVSGTLITLFQRQLIDHYPLAFTCNILLFGVSCIACFISVQLLPFNTLEILWDTKQWLRLLLSYLLLALPFFFVSNAIALSLIYFHSRLSLLYGFDLIGAGAGAVGLIVLLQHMSANDALRVLGMLGVIAVLFALGGFGRKHKWLIAGLVGLSVVVIAVLPQQWLELRMSGYKGLQQAMLIKDVEHLGHSSDSVSRIDILRSDAIPVRHAPGLSLRSPALPPPQLIVFSDGDEMHVIDEEVDDESLRYRQYMSTSLPYHVKPSPRSVLVLNANTGNDVREAVKNGALRVDGIEADAKLSSLVMHEYADSSLWRNYTDKVSMHTITPRGFAAASDAIYDLVIMALPGASTGSAAGVNALAVSYDLTQEALASYIGLLTDGGMLSITMWTSTPPRGNLRLFATVVESLRHAGIENPGERLAWIRSWNTATLLIKNGDFTRTEIESIREFSKQRAFDLAWLPDIRQQEVNRYQVLQQPLYYMSASALLSTDSMNFLDSYKYDIHPTSDDTPYFSNYFKWSSLAELLSLKGSAGMAMIDVGYPTLLATLAQAAITALLLILLPLWLLKSRSGHAPGVRGKVVVYFLGIGLAFLFIEIAFIQTFTLILGQPLYAVAVALCAFLLFSGMGSIFVQWRLSVTGNEGISMVLQRAVIGISAITLTYVIALPELSVTIMALSEPARLVSAFVLAAPLAFFMGMPLPLGLAATREADARLLPWAWGINGCASVLSAVLAVILAIEIGFNGVMLCAMVLYIVALFAGLRIREVCQSATGGT